MNSRNRHLARQLRAALRARRWSADTHVLRLHLSRSTMARVLVGDEEVSLRIYQLVAEALELSVEFVPYQQPAEPLPGAVETVVDEAVMRLRARAGDFLSRPGTASSRVAPQSASTSCPGTLIGLADDQHVGGCRSGRRAEIRRMRWTRRQTWSLLSRQLRRTLAFATRRVYQLGHMPLSQPVL